MKVKTKYLRKVLVILTLCLFAGLLWFAVHTPTDWKDSHLVVEVEETRDNIHIPSLKTEAFSDLHITVKTTKKFHTERLKLLLKTWIKKVINQTYIITDEDDKDLKRQFGDRLVVTSCGKTHNRDDLCCKTAEEYETFITQDKKWWCHVDDDTYVNTKQLASLLQTYNSRDCVYLGRMSVVQGEMTLYYGIKKHYYFATGGFYCLSRKLAERMEQWMRHGSFVSSCRRFSVADDATLGFIITNRLQVPVISSSFIHTKFEDFNTSFQGISLENQVGLSYDKRLKKLKPFDDNHLPAFNDSSDPTSYLSIHCLLYPNESICP